MKGFQKALDDCELMDRGFLGPWFNWEKRNLPETNTRKRLDRRVVNSHWLTLFLEYSIEHLPHSFLDHCPLLIQTVQSKKNWRM